MRGPYKEDSTNYSTLHSWAKNHFDDPALCEFCKDNSKKLDWAIKGEVYTRNRRDWYRLCRSCHIKYDRGRTPRKTHCRHGHKFTDDNSLIVGTKRWCRICRREANRKLYWSKRCAK